MHVVVVGCGRVGSTVARELSDGGHDVVVVDRRADAFRRLGDDFAGRTKVGVGFDRELLTEVGVTADSAVMAVTSGDNSNILIARVARETFGVQRVVARIYDPTRASIYERLGIATVASVAWTAARAVQHILPPDDSASWFDPSTKFALAMRRVPASGAGVSLAAVDEAGGHVTLVTRFGEGRLPEPGMLLQEGDVVFVMMPIDGGAALDALLAGHHGGGH
jgi:trk system potassium uptake protein